MKFILILLLALPLLAADAPKPLPDAEQVRITRAQNAVLRLDSAQKQLQLQYAANEKAIQAAQGELAAAIEGAKKAHGCASITDALECVPVAKAETKKEK